MRGVGFSLRDIQIQYITKLFVIISFAIFFGTFVSVIGGQYLVNIFGSIMGATQIKLIIIPIQAYVILPISLLIIVIFATLISSSASIYKTNIAKLIQE